MTNPLIEKYNELYHPKPQEPPKPVEKPVKLKTYDLDDLKASFVAVAERVKNNKAQVSSMNMEMDVRYGLNKITFEVYVGD